MKEKSFGFRESFGQAIKSMNDKQAGKFIKALVEYAFRGKELSSSDSVLKSGFVLIKAALDAQIRDRENGRIGGNVSAEKRKSEQSGLILIAGLGKRVYPMETASESSSIKENTDEHDSHK